MKGGDSMFEIAAAVLTAAAAVVKVIGENTGK